MSRRLAFAGAMGALASGALLTLVISVDRPRPVDVRRVDLSPVQPGMLSATHTTTLAVQQPTAVPVSTGEPGERPAIPVTVTDATSPSSDPITTAPSTSSVAKPPKPTKPTKPSRGWPDRNNCDPSYVTDGVCVPWFFPMDPREACEWLREQGLTRIEVRGRDRHHLDPDRDGVACEWVKPD